MDYIAKESPFMTRLVTCFKLTSVLSQVQFLLDEIRNSLPISVVLLLAIKLYYMLQLNKYYKWLKAIDESKYILVQCSQSI